MYQPQGYNLCYSTLVSNQDVDRLSAEQYEKSPTGHVFVKATTRKGILPQILDELLAARKRAKKDMAAATDPIEKAVQNGRQLALKVSANSVYGFTGANVGQLPCLPIASSVTSYGRNLLLATRSFVESKYTIANGYKYNAEVRCYPLSFSMFIANNTSFIRFEKSRLSTEIQTRYFLERNAV